MRKYAFGDLSVPRDDTQYLKIKYPARYPALPEVSFDASCTYHVHTNNDVLCQPKKKKKQELLPEKWDYCCRDERTGGRTDGRTDRPTDYRLADQRRAFFLRFARAGREHFV